MRKVIKILHSLIVVLFLLRLADCVYKFGLRPVHCPLNNYKASCDQFWGLCTPGIYRILDICGKLHIGQTGHPVADQISVQFIVITFS